jgi:hypothetical protein
MTGKTSLKIDGAGFWECDDIIVRFTSINDEEVPPRGSPGVYDPSTKTIQCFTPKFAATGPVKVDVAMDGRNFAPQQLDFIYYSGEDLEAEVEPAFCGAKGGSQLALNKCTGVNASMRTIKVKFVPEDPEAPEMVVNAYVVETEIEEMDEKGLPVNVMSTGLVCTTPCYVSDKWKLPVVASICVALNGVDFMAVAGASITFADAHFDRISPTCGPLGAPTSIIVKGESFVDNGKGKVKFCYKSGEVDIVAATFVNAETMRVSVPSPDTNSGKECALLTVSFDDETWISGSSDICYSYFGTLPRASSSPASGPSTGETKVTCFVPFDCFFQPKIKMARNGASEIVAVTLGDLVTRAVTVEDIGGSADDTGDEDAAKTDDVATAPAVDRAKPNAVSGYELYFETPPCAMPTPLGMSPKSSLMKIYYLLRH